MFDLPSLERGLMFDSHLQNTCDRNDWAEDYFGYDNDPFHGVKECEINKNNAEYNKYGSDKLYLD